VPSTPIGRGASVHKMRTETATVESIDAKTRTITLKRPDGTFVGTVAGPEVKRFSEIKVGDKVSATAGSTRPKCRTRRLSLR
jgi:hypothetical protein